MTRDRAISTVVDVTVCLLLVGASVATLATTSASHADPGPTRTATVVLGAATADVAYRTPSAGTERTARATLAGLLADAAVIRARPPPDRPTGFAPGVRNATHRTLAALERRTQVVATWRPFPGSSIEGRIVVGPTPSGDADVDAARFDVPLDRTASRRQIRAAAADGYGALADVVAASVRTRLSRSARHLATGASADGRLDERIERALRATSSSPAAAGRAVAVDRVRVVVRTWSA